MRAPFYLLACLVIPFLVLRQEDGDRNQLKKLVEDGNYKEALEGLRTELLRGPIGEDRSQEVALAVQCLQHLGRIDEADALLDAVAARHGARYEMLFAAAESLWELPAFGTLVGGEFHRADRRAQGIRVQSQERDRTRALAWMQAALAVMPAEEPAANRGRFLLRFASMTLRSGGDAWLLQTRTDLSSLPDYVEGYGARAPAGGAPVKEDGSPVLFEVPASWESARNDGERWRWLLSAARSTDPASSDLARLAHAEFLQQQFGVQTAGAGEGMDPARREEFRTLADDETICRLATGIERLRLPAGHQFIPLLEELAASATPGVQKQVLVMLGSIFERRDQLARAADAYARGGQRDRAQQILGNWGEFEATRTQPAGSPARLFYRFRNGARVHLTAHRIRIDRVLDDLRDELRSGPQNLSGRQLSIEQIGHRIIQNRETRYLADRVADWERTLPEALGHRTLREEIATPLQEAGAYLVVARMEGGNESRIVVWLADMALVRKTLDQGVLYFVADARTGAPLPGVSVDLLGFRWKREQRQAARLELLELQRTSNENGLVVLGSDEVLPGYTWIAVARTGGGRLAYLGFQGIWYQEYRGDAPVDARAYLVTDRPVYRPGQKVHFKGWLRQVSYAEGAEQALQTTCQVKVSDARNEELLSRDVDTDESGAFDGELTLAEDAALGSYSLQVAGPANGWLRFRVEEYKKPEFEVKVELPDRPIRLGESFTATVRADYYFGAPVSEGRVHYTVRRVTSRSQWYPPGPWDWLYGTGYGWLVPDADWHPGFERWGCHGPSPWWWSPRSDPPEIVAENEVELDENGRLSISIDSALAQKIHGDVDQRYTIEAEVVDPSRRTITGSGAVLAAARPYRLFVWVDHGYYSAGDVIRVQARARSPDGQPVAGEASLRMLRLRPGKDGVPEETEVQSLDLTTSGGDAETLLEARSGGQYRLAVRWTDGRGQVEEAATIVTIRGEGGEEDFRFNDLELVRKNAESSPGESAELMLQTDRAGSTVLVFVRPVNGVYQLPQVTTLTGKSRRLEIPVSRGDMPNFFVEALTVVDGKVVTAVQMIPVPPDDRLLEVQLTPTGQEFEPGAACEVDVTLRNEGKPFPGALCVTVYDKALEYIAGGSNRADISAYFWGWRRHHQPRTADNLNRTYWHIPKEGEVGMVELGGGMAQFLTSGSAGFRVEKKLRALGYADGELVAEAAAAPATARYQAGDDADAEADSYQAPAAAPPDIETRSNFADTACWVASLPTDAVGKARFSFVLPDSLTTWKILGTALGEGTRVGSASAEIITVKKLFVRLQAPRFFIERDEVVLSGNVHNERDESVSARVRLEVPQHLAVLGDLEQGVEIPAHGQVRVDWRVRVTGEGPATLRMAAWNETDADRVEMSFPAYRYGAPRMESFAGVLRPEAQVGGIDFEIPAQRRDETTRFSLRYSPTVAGALIDALPYLVSFPYGCTEQTLNRFLPTVLVQRLLQSWDLDLEALRNRRSNLDPGEVGPASERAAAWQRYEHDPVFDEAEVVRMATAGVAELVAMQLGDGGWGWFSGFGESSDAYLTAWILRGLLVARDNDVAIPAEVIERAAAWLASYQQAEITKLENFSTKKHPQKEHASALDGLIHLVLVEYGRGSETMKGFLLRDRTKLPPYALAILALALHAQADLGGSALVQRNLEQFLVQDDENQTAYLDLPLAGYWWHWYGSDAEAHAFYLELLSRVEPGSEKASQIARYLLRQRKHATYWNSTRDTALCIEALAHYAEASGERLSDLRVEILLDGTLHKEVSIGPENLLDFDPGVEFAAEALSTGRHRVEIRKTGTGSLYFHAELEYFSMQDTIRSAGLDVRVERRLFRIREETAGQGVADRKGQVISQQVAREEREELHDLSRLSSGDLIEVELIVESKNDYEFVVIEDRKAAGLESVAVQSGYARRGMRAYVEYRDERVALFLRQLPRGRHSLSYRLRAEIPGEFVALPAQAVALYAPELRGNSASTRLIVEEDSP